MFSLSFQYNKEGFGDLVLRSNGETLAAYLCRTGSIGTDGLLKNAIEPHFWYLCRGPEPVAPDEADKMFVAGQPGRAWKERLWAYPVPPDHEITSHYLIHPDGGKPGSMGCIVPQNTNAMDLYYFFQWHFTRTQESLTLLVERTA